MSSVKRPPRRRLGIAAGGRASIVYDMTTRLLGLLLLVVSSSSWALERTEVFPFGMDGVKVYRIPGLLVTPKGTLLAYCEARRDGKSDWGEIEVRMRRSTDGGATWSPSTQLAHLGPRIEGNPRKKTGGEHEQTVNNPVMVADRETGAITLLYCVNYARAFLRRSTDDGVTWSTPTEVTAVFEPFRKHRDWKVIATGPGHGIQLRSGRMVVPVWLAYGKVGDHGPAFSGTIYSDDRGATWKAGDVVMPNQPDLGSPNESMVAELSDGRVMFVTRTTAKPNRKLVAYSADGASGWTAPAFHPDLWEPVCMASLTALISPSPALLFSAPRRVAVDKDGREVPAGKGKRENLSVMLSTDDGRTWPVLRTLEAGPSAYSDLGAHGEKIFCLYEGGAGIWIARFDLDWIRGK
ncbi:MAG: sialidase family protein [Opitutales bacterium]